MRDPLHHALFCALLPTALLASCSDDARVETTGFPGQFSAGGGTSGEVIARTGEERTVEGASGTPGIPEGSGGNTSGAALGGTTSGSTLAGGGTAPAAADGTASAPSAGTTPPADAGASAPSASPASSAPSAGAAAPSPPSAGTAASASAPQSEADRKAAEAARAEREKQQLAAAMDRIAERWQQQAAGAGRKAAAPTPVDAQQGFEQSERQSSPSGQPEGELSPRAAEHPIRSEKRGTAPPSEDVKQPR